MEANESLSFPSRSVLFNINPIGTGTPYVESLTSYISRLANYHCVFTGTLLSKFLSSHLNKFYITQIADRGGNGFYDSSNGINGIGILARDFIDVIQSLNFRTDLNKTTLIGWSNVLPTRGLMRTEKAWCANCYQEALINNEPIYDQLLWYLKAVHCCPKHQIALDSECANCSKTMQIFSRKTIPGYCQHCHHWLGTRKCSPIMESTEENIQVAEMIGNMLSYSSSESFEEFGENIVSQSFKKILELLFDGKIAKMSKLLPFPETTLRYWINGLNLSPLPQLIKTCLQLNISILEFLGVKEFPANMAFKEKPLLIVSNKPRNKFDHKNIKQILDEEIKREQPQSLKKVAEIIGCDRKLLYKKFPFESKKIVENFQSYLKEEKIKRKNEIRNKLKRIANQLSQKNEYPSRRKVELLLDHKYFVKEKSIREQWHILKDDYSKY